MIERLNKCSTPPAPEEKAPVVAACQEMMLAERERGRYTGKRY